MASALHDGPSVSVVVPAHRDCAEFRQCLASLDRLSPTPLERIVVVDGDDDDVRQAAEASGARVVRLARNGGPARARNEGARVASGDVLLFLDADVSPHADTVGRVAARFAGDPALSAVIGSYDDEPSDPRFLSQYRNLLHHFVHQRSRGTASTFWGACGAIRRGLFLDAGGFDESYRHPSIEDIELGVRLARLGRRVELDKGLLVTHHKRWTARSILHTDVFRRAAPWSELILRSGSLPNDLNVDRASRASAAGVFAIPVLAIAALWVPEALVAVAVLLVTLIALNAGFYGFLWRARGASFALRAIPWHAVYYVCCGVGLALAMLRLASSRRTPARVEAAFEGTADSAK